MEIAQQFAPAETAPAREDAAAPEVFTPATNYTPRHTKPQSTLERTAEFTRIFLIAWIIRYVFRGMSGAAFEKEVAKPGIRNSVIDAISKPGRALTARLFKNTPLKDALAQMEAGSYAAAIGLGSGYLSYRYSTMVKSDIQNIFGEAVAYENDKRIEDVKFNDITHSDNRIVKRTIGNYREKFFSRIGTDALFLGAAALRHGHLTDLLLGVKGVQIFADTWKRKTTMFEDLVTFVNNKINPRNGLGQAISVGEVFDLYQHYADAFAPDRMFKNVIEGGTAEGVRWAAAQPIFLRMTELMNLTYAYKHSTVIDAKTGRVSAQADFALPKFIYLMGHDLIDVNRPAETMARIEIANRYGIAGVKEMQAMMKAGQSLEQVNARFPLPARPTHEHGQTQPVAEKRNGVMSRGATLQVDAAPETKIDAASVSTEALANNAIPNLAV